MIVLDLIRFLIPSDPIRDLIRDQPVIRDYSPHSSFENGLAIDNHAVCVLDVVRDDLDDVSLIVSIKFETDTTDSLNFQDAKHLDNILFVLSLVAGLELTASPNFPPTHAQFGANMMAASSSFWSPNYQKVP